MSQNETFDLVVVGGGMGGLATAGLAQTFGLKTVLFEAHTNLGGCAGYFARAPYTFDAAATALMGVRPGEPIGELLEILGVDFQAVETTSYRVHLPDRTFDITTDPDRFEDDALACLSGPGWLRNLRQRTFWRLQAAVGNTLFRAAERIPRLPIQSMGDAWHDLRVLGLTGLLAASTSLLTVDDVLRLLGLRGDVPFRALVKMLLQDTAQAGPETVPFANASACIQAYRLGMSRPKGGMQRLVEGIGQRFAAIGGDLRTGEVVSRIEPLESADGGPAGFTVWTRRKQAIQARRIALNLPLNLAAKLLSRPLEGRIGRSAYRSRAVWGAFTGYLAFDRSAIPDDSPLFHQVLQNYDQPTHDGNNVLISLSPTSDAGYGPSDVRVATLSTHTHPGSWFDLDRANYLARKAIYRNRLLNAVDLAIPGASAQLRHAEFASPRSFVRYTRRVAGAVGGPPVGRLNSNLMAVGSDIFGPGIWVVGDSVFPGQGTMATVLSAIRVVERLTGISWSRAKAERRVERIPAEVGLA